MSIDSISQAALANGSHKMRSFPPDHDSHVSRYPAPFSVYEMLLLGSAGSESVAGWLFAEDPSAPPVFVANSLLSALTLVQTTLPADTLTEDSWAQLTFAANTLAQHPGTRSQSPAGESEHDEVAPPSAQPPKRRRQEPPTRDGHASEDEVEPLSPSALVQHTQQTQHAQSAPFASKDLKRSVTNRNGRLERRRQEREAEAVTKRKLSTGLQEPVRSACVKEKQAYEAIPPGDFSEVAWIIKQRVPEGQLDLYQALSTPYYTACDLLAKARCVDTAWSGSNVATFIKTWREYGCPVSAGSSMPVLSQIDGTDTLDGRFQRAYHRSRMCEDRVNIATIACRWAMAFLGRAYQEKIIQIAGGGDTKRARTLAINALLPLVGAGEDRNRFVRRLVQATRWYEMACTIGWGILCLLPFAVSMRWIRECPAPAWLLWLELVKRNSPDTCAASQTLEQWFGEDGLQGGGIETREKLMIEEMDSVVRVEEVPDTDASDSDVEMLIESSEPTQRPLASCSIRELVQVCNLDGA
jgi:hypothetical protein